MLGLWGVGDAMIIFLAGLLDVPRQLYEAAEIEGANGRQKFRFVTLPMISPVIFFSLVIGVIYGFQLFTQAYVASLAATGSSVTEAASNLGAPQGSMLFYAIYLYQQGFQDFRMGYASAMAWVLFVITMICTHRDREGVATVGALPGRRVPMTTVDGQETRLEEVGDAFDLGAIPGIDSPSDPPAREAASLPELRRATRDPDRVRGDVPRAVLLHRDDGADDQGPGRHALVHPSSVRLEQLRRRSSIGSRSSGTPGTPLQIALLSTVGIILSCIPVAYALGADALEGSPGGVPARALDVDAARPGDDRAALRPVGPLGPDRPPDAADPAELPRRRVLDLPAAAVLHDDPRGAVRRRPRGRRERVPDHDARDRAAGQARDRGRRAVQLPLQLERPVLAAALPGEEPEALDADARPHGVPAAARHGVEPHAWRCRS